MSALQSTAALGAGDVRSALRQSALLKNAWRMLPPLTAAFIFNYIDQPGIGFAACDRRNITPQIDRLKFSQFEPMKSLRAEAHRGFAHLPDDGCLEAIRSEGLAVNLTELMMILELHRQGLSMSASSERTGHDRKTLRKFIQQGLIVPQYKPRACRATRVGPFEDHFRERVAAWPELTGERLRREICKLGHVGGKTEVNDFLRQVKGYEIPRLTRWSTRTLGTSRRRENASC